VTERARKNSCTQVGKNQLLRVSRIAGVGAVIRAPFKLIGAAGGLVCFNSSPAVVCREVSPALPEGVDYHNDFTVKVSLPSTGGMLLLQFSGNRTLFTSEQSRVNPLEYLSDRLTAFSQQNPDFATRLKKRLLFSKLFIKLFHRFLAPAYADLGLKSERDVYDMLGTDSATQSTKYNLVITDKKIIFARIATGIKFVDWLLSKHLFAAGYDACVLFAGEVWKDANGVIHINGNSGTYRPIEEKVLAAGRFMQAVFPHLSVVVDLWSYSA
jgi:hypothetical protein